MLSTDIDECASGPCLNGGICRDKVNGYECICTSAFSGIICETRKSLYNLISISFTIRAVRNWYRKQMNVEPMSSYHVIITIEHFFCIVLRDA